MTTPSAEATFKSELQFIFRRVTYAAMGDALLVLLMLATLIL